MSTEPVTNDDELEEDGGYTAPVNPDQEPTGTLYFGTVLAAIGLMLFFFGAPQLAVVAVPAGLLLICTGLILRAIHRAGERVARVIADVAHHRL